MPRQRRPSIHDFRDYLKSSTNLSDNTISAYVGVATRLMESRQRPDTWVKSTIDSQTPLSTARFRTASAAHYYDWLMSLGMEVSLLGPRPSLQLRPRAFRDSVEQADHRMAISPAALARVHKALERDSSLSPAVRTVLLLVGMTGLSVAELCAVKTKDLGRAEGTTAYGVKVTSGRRRRWVPLTEKARMTLQFYIRKRETPSSPWLFPSGKDPNTDHLNWRWVNEAWRKTRRHLGTWAEEIRPDQLRRAYRAALEQTGAEPALIRAILGLSEPGFKPSPSALARVVRAL